MKPEEALKSVMQEYGTQLLRVCTIFLNDYQLAEDVVQETFYRIYGRYCRTGNTDVFQKQYAIKTAINLCKNQMRTNWFRTIKSDKLSARLETASPRTDARTDEEHAVFSAVTTLKPMYKEVILLYYYEELSVREIAELLKLKESTVKVRLKRARDMIRNDLEGL